MSERPFAGVRRALRLGSVRRDVDEELAFHFDTTVEALMAEGHSRPEAEEVAARRFGDAARYRGELERIDTALDSRRRLLLRYDAARHVLASALRSIVRSPAFSLAVIAVFALGIGANATMLQTIDRLLFRAPAHVAAPESVHRIYIERFRGPPFNDRHATDRLTYPDVEDLRGTRSFSGVAGYSPRRVRVGHGVSAEALDALFVTGDYWEVLGIRPALGRFFDMAEDAAGADPVVVISHALWRSRFDGSPNVLGETLDFGHGPYTIVGVAPPGMTDLDLRRADVIVPLVTYTHAAGNARLLGRDMIWVFAVARLAPGMTLAAAAEEATSLHRAAWADAIAADRHDAGATVLPASLIPAQGPNTPPEAKVALWLGGVAFFVLLIACLNVANLLLARALRQRREIGIRLALGITRRRLASQLVLEGVLLALAGGAAALLLNRWAGDALRARLLPDVAWDQLAPDRTIVLAVVGLAVLAGIIAALLPVFDATRRNAARVIAAGAGNISRSAHRSRAALAAVQAALCVILLVGAGLFLRSVGNVHTTDLGFDVAGLYFVSLETAGEFAPGERLAMHLDVAERLGRLPGVASATTSGMVPFTNVINARARIPGRDSLPRAAGGGPYISPIAPNYFETLGMRMLRGRAFDERDGEGAANVAIIGAAFASAAWPDGDAVGSCIVLGDGDAPCTTIVGVVTDANSTHLTQRESFQIFVPAAQARAETGGVSAVLARVSGAPRHVLPLLRAELHAVDPRIRYAEIQPLRNFLAAQTRAWTLGATLFTAFGVLALLVAAVGMYSVVAFDVAERRREIGLRAALGAGTPRIVRAVVWHAVRVTGTGVLSGMAVAMLLAPRLEGMLYGVPVYDPATLGVVTGVMLCVAIFASWLPARRAARVQPGEALRAD